MARLERAMIWFILVCLMVMGVANVIGDIAHYMAYHN